MNQINPIPIESGDDRRVTSVPAPEQIPAIPSKKAPRPKKEQTLLQAISDGPVEKELLRYIHGLEDVGTCFAEIPESITDIDTDLSNTLAVLHLLLRHRKDFSAILPPLLERIQLGHPPWRWQDRLSSFQNFQELFRTFPQAKPDVHLDPRPEPPPWIATGSRSKNFVSLIFLGRCLETDDLEELVPAFLDCLDCPWSPYKKVGIPDEAKRRDILLEFFTPANLHHPTKFRTLAEAWRRQLRDVAPRLANQQQLLADAEREADRSNYQLGELRADLARKQELLLLMEAENNSLKQQLADERMGMDVFRNQARQHMAVLSNKVDRDLIPQLETLVEGLEADLRDANLSRVHWLISQMTDLRQSLNRAKDLELEK